jgi:hypothetical protein
MKPEGEAQGDDVQDVDYEEVSREMIFLNRVVKTRCKSEAFQNKCRDTVVDFTIKKPS